MSPRRSGTGRGVIDLGPSIGQLAIALASALGELHARGDLTHSELAFGLRLVVRQGRDGQFFESVETSARVLGQSQRTARRARDRMVALGLLEEVGGKHAPGRARRFMVRIPAELLDGYQARLRPETGDRVLSPVGTGEGEPDRGHGEPHQGTISNGTGDKSGPDRGQSFVPQTSEPMNLKEPGNRARSVGSALAAAVAPFRAGAPRGGAMTEEAERARKAELARQKVEMFAKYGAGQAEEA